MKTILKNNGALWARIMICVILGISLISLNILLADLDAKISKTESKITKHKKRIDELTNQRREFFLIDDYK